MKSSGGNGNAVEIGERVEGDDFEDGAEIGLGKVDKGHHPHVPHVFGHHHEEGKAVWAKECWEDLKVGDFVRLHGDESVPAG